MSQRRATTAPEPVQRERALAHHDQPFQPRHAFEQGRCNRPGGNRHAGSRMALDQIAEKPGRQHGIANTCRGYEQNIHVADLGALYRAARCLAKPAP